MEFLAVISGVYGETYDYTSATQAAAYIAGHGLEFSATHDPENFWGQFSMFLPSIIIIDLETMEIAQLSGGMTAGTIRSTLDGMLGI